jgi:hypothetical protein
VAQTNGQPRLDEAERYRRAAEDALQQLDWAIGYIHGIKKWKVSRVLARNRTEIRRNLVDAPNEPLPAEPTAGK